MKTTTIIIIITAASFLVSCNSKKDTVTMTPPSTAPSAELSKVLATAPSGEARAIAVVRSSVKPGDEVTLSGKIMGNKSPFVAGRAVFILGDPAVLTPCNAKPGDGCETPWDTCCDSPEDKKRATASIQIVGADGRVLKEAIEGVNGIDKLAAITVSGKVAEGSSADLLIVNATALRVGK
jgi:uncharacterized lipoprotein YajG